MYGILSNVDHSCTYMLAVVVPTISIIVVYYNDCA